MTNQNKKQKLNPREHDWHYACQEMIEKNTANTPCCDCYGHKCKDTPPSKSSSWEEKLKSYMIDLIDEYFPKDNQDNPELPSTTHRREAMASHALFLIKFKEVFASERAEEREKVLKELLEKMPKEGDVDMIDELYMNGWNAYRKENLKVVNSLKGEK